MTASAQSPFGRSDTASRGIMLIVAAVALGLLFLWKAYDGGTVATADVDDTNDTTVTSTLPPVTATTPDGGTVIVTTTTTLPEPIADSARPPAEVKVLVANATGQSRVAGTLTDAVGAAAYITEEPANAPTGPDSKIYYKLGYAADAREIALLLNAPLTVVEQAPATSPVNENAAARYESAHITVVVGSDGQVPFSG